MKKLNCILIHVPRFYEENNVLFSDINIAAIGLFSIAGELIKEGHKAKIIHLGIEKYLNKNFDICDYIKQNKIEFAALSLNWHHQSKSIIETAEKIKQKCPDVFVSLGGNTATFFAKEIMEKFSFIDGIIKGEGEIPMKELANSIAAGSSLSEVQNLCWRDNKQIVENELSFFASDEDLSRFQYFNPDNMLHYEEYSKIPYIIDYSKENQLTLSNSEQVICLGRGCLGNCAWCAGGFNVTKKATGRNCVSYRNIENIIDEMKLLKEKYNIQTFRFSFDPNPKDRNFLINLFNEISKTFDKKINAIYNLDGLPSPNFLDAFKRTFSDKSTLLLSPLSQNEEIRKKYKSFFYTNEQLEQVLDYMEKLHINSEIYFSALPISDKKEYSANEKYGKFLKEKYSFLNDIYSYDIEITPNSPMFLNPEKYGVKSKENFLKYL